MKKLLSNRKTGRLLLICLALLIAVHVYTMAAPISYEKSYTFEGIAAGMEFESDTTFRKDNRVSILNSNFSEPKEYYYYCKDGYVFFLMAEDEAAYQEEVAQINADWDESVNRPFYASRVNAFQLIHDEEELMLTLTCKPAIASAVAFGIAELAVAGLAAASFVCSRKESAKGSGK